MDKVMKHRIHDALQNACGSIEATARSIKKQALIFPASKDWMIQDLKSLQKQIGGIIAALEMLTDE